jgi:hypothetical protein
LGSNRLAATSNLSRQGPKGFSSADPLSKELELAKKNELLSESFCLMDDLNGLEYAESNISSGIEDTSESSISSSISSMIEDPTSAASAACIGVT